MSSEWEYFERLRRARLSETTTEMRSSIAPALVETSDIPQPEPPESSTLAGKIVDVAGDVVADAIPAAFRGVAETAAEFALHVDDFVLEAPQFAGVKPIAEKFGVDLEKASVLDIVGMREQVESFINEREPSLVGNLVHDTSNFLTAFVLFRGRMKGSVKALEGVTRGSRVALDAAAGALADFSTTDVVENSLKTLIERSGSPNLLSAYADFMERGSPVEQRLKAAAVGTLGGLAADGVMLGARWIRAKNAARKTIQTAVSEGALDEAALARLGPQMTPEQLRITDAFDVEDQTVLRLRDTTDVAVGRLTRIEADLARRLPNATDSALHDLAVKLDPASTQFNWNVVDDPDRIQQMVDDFSKVLEPGLAKARRGKRPRVLAEAEAAEIRPGIEDVIATRRGTALNDSQMIAWGTVWRSAADHARTLLERAEATGAELDLIRSRRMLAVFGAVHEAAMGVRAEAGRSLNAIKWAFQKGDPNVGRQITGLLDEMGGYSFNRDMAKRALDVMRLHAMPESAGAFAAKSTKPTFRGFVEESYVLGLLWEFSTHAVNMASTAIQPVLTVMSHAVGEATSAFFAREGADRVLRGETAALIRGGARGVKDASKVPLLMLDELLARRASLAGIRGMLRLSRLADDELEEIMEATGSGTAARRLEVTGNIHAEALRLSPDSGLGRAVEWYGAAARIPGFMLRLGDSPFKVIGYRMWQENEAYRRAIFEGIDNGWDEKRVAERVVELVRNPSPGMKMASVNKALYQTFNDKAVGSVAQLMRKAQALPYLGRMLFMPFVNTPARVFSMAFESVPGANFLIRDSREAFLRGGRDADLALGKVAVGAGIMGLMLDAAMDGYMIGPLPRDQGDKEAYLRSGVDPDSMLVGNTVTRFNRLDPLGIWNSLSGAMANILLLRNIEDEDLEIVEESMGAMISGLQSAVMNRSFMTGLSRTLDAITNPDPGGTKLGKITGTVAQNLVPASSLWRTLRTLTNEEKPQFYGVPDALLAQIPLLEQRLPRSRDLWGRAIPDLRINLFSPVAVRPLAWTPADTEIARYGMNIQRIRKTNTFDGVKVDFREFPNVFEAYQQLAGNDLKHPRWNKGAMDFLSDVVTGKQGRFSDMYQRKLPDEKRNFFQGKIEEYRDLAGRVLMDERGPYQGEEFQRFRSHVKTKQARMRAIHMNRYDLKPDTVERLQGLRVPVVGERVPE